MFNQVLGGWGRVQKIKNEKESKRVLKQTKNEETLFIHMKVLKLKRNSWVEKKNQIKQSKNKGKKS